MPHFPWQKSRNSRGNQSSSIFVDGAQQHPDLPLTPSGPRSNLQRSASVTERHAHHLDNRRSIALFSTHNSSLDTAAPGHTQSTTSHNVVSTTASPLPSQSGSPTPGVSRSQTVVYRDASIRNRDCEPIYEAPAATPSTPWSPDFQLTPDEQQETRSEKDLAPMSGAPGKTSSDSGSASGTLDRWSQRRLQRLNTEQGFREQRQGVGGTLISSTPTTEHSSFLQQTLANNYDPAQPQSLHQHSQPQQHSTYPSSRTASNAGLSGQSSSNNNTRSTSNYAHDSSSQQPGSQQYSPDAVAQYQAHHNGRAALQQTRSYQSTSGNAAALEADSMSLSNSNGNAAAAKASRSGVRQSVHTDMLARESSGQLGSQGVPAFNAAVVPPVSRGSTFHSDTTSQQQQQPGQPDLRRPTPQPLPTSEDMTHEEINQLIKDHKELREKYTKVKKYYFEKEDQVKQLQNSLAHQRLSQSRTSLDDSEYSTRFNRLDGLVAQLAFSIRKSWRVLPPWLSGSVNKDAIATGKQEMTAAGRAFISQWLVEEVFDKYFHPDLEPALSAQLKSVQRNIRRYATPAQTAEEEDYLTTKVVNWRLATLEGLTDALRSAQCPTYRAQMTDMLKEHLCTALASHLQEPAPSDLEGGVHMIVELVVSMAIHLPLESRDVVIEYFMPQHPIMPDQMKVESGIPALTLSIADDYADRASAKSTTSDADSSVEPAPAKKRGMLSALTGSGNKLSRNAGQQQKSSAGASSSSLHRPESSTGKDEPPKVRMAAGIGVAIRGRSVLVKAPVFST